MKQIKHYLWILPLIGLLLNLSSFFFPLMSTSSIPPIMNWMIGLEFSAFGYYLTPNEYLLLFSFVSSMIIILISYGLFRNMQFIFKNRQKSRDIKLSKFWFAWILMGIFSILSIYIFISFDFWDEFDFSWDYWELFSSSTGVLLLYISGAWMIISGVLLKFLDMNNYI